MLWQEFGVGNPEARGACRATPASAAGGGSSEQGLAPRSKFAERERDVRISGTARGVAKQLQVLLPLPSKGYKKDIATENIDFIKVFSVFMGKISANGLNAQKRYFS